jgi:RNA polymerase sigma-70 factor, ECF subfamily
MNRADGETDRRRRFGDMCESLRPDLLRFAFWLGRDRGLAEDVVQESLLRAWKSIDSLEDEGKAKAWLLTIVRREFARSFERKRHELADLDALVSAESDALAAPGDERLAEMRAAIFRLDEEYREPLVLQVLMGFSTKEIAGMMGLQQGAVLTRLFRARARLRHTLGYAGDAEPES